MTPLHSLTRKIFCPLLFCGLALLAIMSLLPHSATAIWQIRWYPLHIASLSLVTLGLYGFLIGHALQVSRSMLALMWMLGLLSFGCLVSCFTGPFPVRSLIYSFPLFSAICCGSLMLLTFTAEGLQSLFRSRNFQGALCLFVGVWCGVSVYFFLSGELLPFLKMAKTLDQAADGGLYSLILNEGLPKIRNAEPFGHPNYNSGFLLLVLPLLLHSIRNPAGIWMRRCSLGLFVVGFVLLLSTQSRNAVFGAAVAAVMYLWWSRPPQKKFVLSILGIGVVFAFLLLWVPRFSHAFSVSPGRLGIWKAAWLTGLKYFPFGCGEGLTPELMAYFSPVLNAAWESSIQFHHTWLHAWAVGGLFAFTALLGVTFWILIHIFKSAHLDAEDRKMLAPSVMALAASFILFWADYQLDIFPIALILFFHLAVFSTAFEKKNLRWQGSKPLGAGLLILSTFTLLISLTRIPASIESRQAVERAGAAFENGKTDEAVSAFLEANDAVAEPYALNMAGMLLSRNPRTHSDAIRLFEQSLSLWEAQVLAHEFLVALYMHEAEHDAAPAEKTALLTKALSHADRRVQMAPQLQGSYLDQAQIRQHLGQPESEVIKSLFHELVMQGDLLFPATWHELGSLEVYQPKVYEKLMSREVSNTQPEILHRIQYLQGYLYLMDQIPAEMNVPEEVVGLIHFRLQQPGSLYLLQEVCEVEGETRVSAMKRLLVYLFKAPVSDEMVLAFSGQVGEGENCVAELLTFGQAKRATQQYGGVGINARHPYSLPVPRPRTYPEAFGSRFLPAWGGKSFLLESVSE
ncbi:O-antigen ligase family protein [Kiritimatiellaeota bacterium B1221]|nr:O-antigen ligase family protein [Kiritimatiellaeota bacterium B1221]